MDTSGKTLTHESLVVLADTVTSDEPSDIVQSNILFVNFLFDEYLRLAEIPADAMRSYSVDYFVEQFENGGFSQFVYNSSWDPGVVAYIRAGLQAMGATHTLAAFEQGVALVESLGEATLKAYLKSEYFGPNKTRDQLRPIDEAIRAASAQENIAELHAAWLRQHPKLFPVQTEAEMKAEAQRRGQTLPDRDTRIAEARAREPRHLKLIRMLCAAAEQELDRLTAASPIEVEGDKTFAYHFVTNQGHHHMIDHGGKAMMFRGHTKEQVAVVDAPADLRPN